MRIAELEFHNEQLEKIRKDIITSININPLPDRSNSMIQSQRLLHLTDSMAEMPQRPQPDVEEARLLKSDRTRSHADLPKLKSTLNFDDPRTEPDRPFDNYSRSIQQSLQMLQLPLKHMQYNPAMGEVSRNFPMPSERKQNSTDEDPRLHRFQPSRLEKS